MFVQKQSPRRPALSEVQLSAVRVSGATQPPISTLLSRLSHCRKQSQTSKFSFRPMPLATLNDIFFGATERNLDRAMLYREAGEWLPISSSDLCRNVAGTVRALKEWGIHKGDRVAILSENRPEWSTVDFAILLLGAVAVPVYSTLTPEQTAYTLRDSGASIVFVSTDLQLRKIQTIL